MKTGEFMTDTKYPLDLERIFTRYDKGLTIQHLMPEHVVIPFIRSLLAELALKNPAVGGEDKIQWVRENFSGNVEMFIDPEAIYAAVKERNAN